MKRIMFFMVIILIIMSLNAKSQELILQGILLGVEDGTEIRINPYLENGVVDMDDQTSIFLKNGKFEFKRKLNRPTKFSLRTMPKIPPDNPLDYEFCSFWAENKLMTLNGVKGKVFSSKVEGSAIQKEYQEYIESLSEYHLMIRRIKETVLSGKSNLTKEEKDELRKQNSLFHKAFANKHEEFIYQHPDYYFAGQQLVTSITNFPNKIEREKIKEFYDTMPAHLKSDIYGTQLSAFLNTKPGNKVVLPLQIGDIPHDFILPNSNEEKVAFSKVKGKLILLDFWASGCGPCRMEHKNYVELYNKYKSKGFEIVSVSQDRSKKRWIDATIKDNMTWISLLDVSNNLSKKQYLVSYLPANFLINENGVIIAKDIRGEILKHELEKQFE